MRLRKFYSKKYSTSASFLTMTYLTSELWPRSFIVSFILVATSSLSPILFGFAASIENDEGSDIRFVVLDLVRVCGNVDP